MRRHRFGLCAESQSQAARAPCSKGILAMIPYEIDPSLHPAQPELPSLDDGFSAPTGAIEAADSKLSDDTGSVGLEAALASKSQF